MANFDCSGEARTAPQFLDDEHACGSPVSTTSMVLIILAWTGFERRNRDYYFPE